MTNSTSESVKHVLWVLVALPALIAAWLVHGNGVDVPFWDEWTIASLLQRMDDGTLTFSALFAQHNEHRMLVPRALQLLGALAVGWDTRVGMWVIQGLLVAMLGGSIALWRRSTLARNQPWTLVSLVLVSLILFSPAQYQSLFWGFQLCFYIPPACLLASTIVASSPAIGLGTALPAIAVLSTAATYSLFPGLLTWPLAAASVILIRGRPRRDTGLKWCGWAAGCACVIGAYFYRYEPPSSTPSVWSALGDPVTLMAGVAACIGGSLGIGTQPVRSATIAGAILTGAFLSLLVAVWRRRSDAQLVASTAPWMVMGGFSVLTAIAIAIGRVGYGSVAMLESRYTSFTAWVIIGIVMLAATLRERLGTVAAARTWSTVCVIVVALSATSFPHHVASVRRTYNERLQSLAIYTFAEAAPRALPMLPPWLDWPAYRKKLIHVEQSGWRKTRPSSAIWVEDGNKRTDCEFGAVEFEDTAGSRRMAGGWAYLPALDRPADAILVTVGASRRITAVQPPLIGRRDIGDRFNSDGALVTGWTLESPEAAPREIMEFWALDMTSLRAYPLCQLTG